MNLDIKWNPVSKALPKSAERWSDATRSDLVLIAFRTDEDDCYVDAGFYYKMTKNPDGDTWWEDIFGVPIDGKVEYWADWPEHPDLK